MPFSLPASGRATPEVIGATIGWSTMGAYGSPLPLVEVF